MLTLVNWMKEQGRAMWVRLAQLMEQRRAELKGETDILTVKKAGDVSMNKCVDVGDERLDLMVNESMDKVFMDKGNHAMAWSGLEKYSGEIGVGNLMEQDDARDENQEIEERKDHEEGSAENNGEGQNVEGEANSKTGKQVREVFIVDQIRRKRTEVEQHGGEKSSLGQNGEEGVESGGPDAKKRRVGGDKKLKKKQARKAKAKGRKRQVHQKRAEQLRNYFFSTQSKIQESLQFHPFNGDCITEKPTVVAIEELKREVFVVRETTAEINKKLQTSLLNQVPFMILSHLYPQVQVQTLRRGVI